MKKLLSYDSYCYTDITTDFSNELGYILDIKGYSYFYTNKEDMDYDDRLICRFLKYRFVFNSFFRDFNTLIKNKYYIYITFKHKHYEKHNKHYRNTYK